MSIAVLTPSRKNGGAEKSAERVSRILSADLVFISDFELIHSTIGRALLFPLTFLKLERFLKKKKIDTVISFQDYSHSFNISLSEDFKKIVSFRTYVPYAFLNKSRIKKVNIKRVLSNLDKTNMLTANSKACADVFNCKLIRNGVNNHLILEKSDINKRKHDLISAGRNVRSKRLDIIDQVFSSFNSIILTNGNLEKSIGWVDDPIPFYSSSKIYVSASEYEGCSNALLEAMARGCVPVVLDAPGVTEVVELVSSDLIVSRKSPVYSLQKKIKELLNSPEKLQELSNKALKVIKKEFNIEKEKRLWRQAVEEVKNECRSAS